jgi:hypothetical protein
MTITTPDTLRQAATELRGYNEQQASLYDVVDENLLALADQLDVLADTPQAALTVPDPAPGEDPNLRIVFRHLKAFAHGYNPLTVAAELLHDLRQSNAPEPPDPDRHQVDIAESLLFAGGYTTNAAVPFEDAEVDAYATVHAALAEDTDPDPDPDELQGNPAGFEFMTVDEAAERGYEYQNGEGLEWRTAPASRPGIIGKQWVLARPAPPSPSPSPAPSPRWNADGNGVGRGEVKPGWTAEIICHGPEAHALAQQAAAALNAAADTPTPAPAPRGPDPDPDPDPQGRDARTIAEDGYANHLLDVKREYRGKADPIARVIRCAVREGRRSSDSDGDTPFYVLAALRELGVQL